MTYIQDRLVRLPDVGRLICETSLGELLDDYSKEELLLRLRTPGEHGITQTMYSSIVRSEALVLDELKASQSVKQHTVRERNPTFQHLRNLSIITFLGPDTVRKGELFERAEVIGVYDCLGLDHQKKYFPVRNYSR